MADAMLSVLKKLNLEHLSGRFECEKVSPDIVYKLSLHDLRNLGLQNRDEIMALRMECNVFGSKKPYQVNDCGPPIYEIPKSVLECYLEENFSISEIAKIMTLSESTIYRRMRKYGLSKLSFSDITDEELDDHIDKITEEFPHCGEGMIKQFLSERGVKVQRSRLRESINRVDRIGVQSRKRGRLHRRVYNVSAPNSLWHVDTNHKLIRWNFVIVGGIDGFSRMPVMLKCTDNNKAETILGCFLNAIHEYGIPSRVRTDMGQENVGIADFMIEARGTGRGSIITGKSTHNQRIERLWRDVFEGVLSFYYNLFYFMEDNNILDPLSEVHLLALHYIYMPKINDKIEMWRNAWSRHRMRTTKSSPLQMWLAGQIKDNNVDDSLAIHDTLRYGVEGIVRESESNQGEDQPFLPPLQLGINEECERELESQSYSSSNYGIEDFKIALEIIKKHVQNINIC